MPATIYNKIFHASAQSSSKDLKWGYKLNPKVFSGLHNTVISINKFKVPFWPPFHNSNPGLLHLADNIGTSSMHHNNGNIVLNDDDGAINDEVSANKTIKLDVENGVRLNDLYNFPPTGFNNVFKVPVTVAQNSKNFVFRLGGLVYVAKNKNNLLVQQGYFRRRR